MKYNCLTKVIWVLIILFYAACKPSSILEVVKKRYVDNCDSILKVPHQDSLYLSESCMAVFQYNYESKLREISGYALGQQYGHNFKFDTFEYLKYYKFIVDEFHYSYGVIYEKETSKYTEIGTPAVEYIDGGEEDKEGHKYHFLFSSFPREEVIILYSLDGRTFYKVNKEKSKLMPFLYEVALKIPLNVRTVYFKMEASGLIRSLYGLEDHKLFLDSTVLKGR